MKLITRPDCPGRQAYHFQKGVHDSSVIRVDFVIFNDFLRFTLTVYEIFSNDMHFSARQSQLRYKMAQKIFIDFNLNFSRLFKWKYTAYWLFYLSVEPDWLSFVAKLLQSLTLLLLVMLFTGESSFDDKQIPISKLVSLHTRSLMTWYET